MKSVFLLSLMACCALAVPLGQVSSYYNPYVGTQGYQGYQGYPGGFWQGVGYQQQYPSGKYYQQQYSSGQWGQQYFSSPVQGLQALNMIEQNLIQYQHQLQENQEVYPQYQWQQYVQAINNYLNQVQQLQGYVQSYVQGSQTIPTVYQSQMIQLFQQIYSLFQQIQSMSQGQVNFGYNQGYQYSSSYPVHQWGGYGLQSGYPYYSYPASYYYQPYQAIQAVV